MRRVGIRCRPVLLTLLLGAGTVRAQQRDTVTLAPVVVTATRVPVALATVAAAVTVLPGAELRARGLRTVADALRTVPGLTVAETGSYGAQTALFVRGGESDYVKVLLDGVPLNQPGGAFDFANLTLENIERIEVVRGPVSVLYGSDAVAGVVQIFTRGAMGQGGARVQAGVRAGTYGTEVLEGDVSGGTPRANYTLAATRFTSDGLYPVNNAYRHGVVSGRLHVAPNPRTEATLTFRYADDVFHYPTDGAGRIADLNQFQSGRGPTIGLDLGRFITPQVEARLLAGYARTLGGISDAADSAADTLDVFRSRDDVRRVTVGPRVNAHVAAGGIVTVGGEVERESQVGTDGGYGFGDTTNVHRTNRALYVQALTGLAGPVSMTVGARMEDNQQFGTVATYRVGAAWRVGSSRALRLRASVGTGFKEPTFFENYAKGFVRGNPDLHPERTRSWEVGVARDFAVGGGAASVSWTYFDQRFRDLIEFTFTPAPPDSVNYFNVTGASARGVEVALVGSLGRGLTASLAYTYLHTRVTDPGFATGPDAAFAPGKRLLRRPDHAATLELLAPVGGRARLSLDARFVGDRDDLDFTTFPATRVTLRAYVATGVGARVDLGRAGPLPAAELEARVDNLFGVRFEEARNFPGRGRAILAGARLRFGN